MMFGGREIEVEELTEQSFADIDIAFFSAGGSISKKFGPIAAKAGAVVVDNSSAFRMDPGVPLVIPGDQSAGHVRASGNHRESELLDDHRHHAAVADSQGQSHPALDRGDVSGGFRSGRGGHGGTGRIHARVPGEPPYENTVLPHPYAFNLFSHNTKIDPETGYNEEETKMVKETQKIFGDPNIRISATCVRVPVLRAHSEALTIECERPITPRGSDGAFVERAGREDRRRSREELLPDAARCVRTG